MDAEFLAQTFAMAAGWQESNTLQALFRARDEGLLPSDDAEKLIGGYRQLRRVEAILRRWSFEGETVLPDDDAPFYRVSVRCGFRALDDFRRSLAKWRGDIRAVFNRVMSSPRQAGETTRR